jgi:hypothetical protein
MIKFISIFFFLTLISFAPKLSANTFDFINIGKKVWTIIEASKGTAEAEEVSVSALPQEVTSPFQMENFKQADKMYRITYKNGFDENVVRIKYLLSYSYGGNHKGKGKYLSGVSIAAANIQIEHGFKVTSTVRVIDIKNIGTLEDPIASIKIKVKLEINGFFNYRERNMEFTINGLGEVHKHLGLMVEDSKH